MNKNEIEASLNGKIIEVRIIATSSEQADKYFEMIELFLTTAMRIQLEWEWKESDR